MAARNRPPKKRQRELDAAPSTVEVADTSYKKVYVVLERACLETIKTKKVISCMNLQTTHLGELQHATLP